MGSDHENQLELFELTRQSAPRPTPYRNALGRILLQVRHDQLILAAVAGVIGLTVIFASGVERGKQLARTERAILTRRQQFSEIPAQRPAMPGAPESRSAESMPQTAVAPSPAAAPAAAVLAPVTPPAAVPAPVEKKTPAKVKAGKSRYAVQVVTFSQPQLAKREMDRLRSRGERAFLVIRDGGRTIVYVGPFPAKENAVEKVSSLKSKYRDCFVKTL